MITPFDDLAYSTVLSYGAPRGFTIPDFFGLVLSVMTKENRGYDPALIGVSGDVGLMQINPRWQPFTSIQDLQDPSFNIATGVRMLKDYINSFGLSGGLGAYNAGPAQRFATIAVNYANSVLGIFNSIRQRVLNLFRRTEYDPSTGTETNPELFYQDYASVTYYEQPEEEFPWWLAFLFFI